MGLFKKILPWVIVLVLTLPIIWPLFHNGYFPMHDDTQPTRVFEMAKALKDGQFPVRWVSDLGYGFGYPIFNFYAPLPYYFGALWIVIEISALTATKMMFGMGIILSGLTMYLLAKKLWGIMGGIVSAVFYLYAPYHAVQIYVRGAVGEYWAYGFLPLIFLGILETKNKLYSGLIIGSIGFAGVILSHNISAIIAAGFLFLWIIFELIKLITKSKNNNFLYSILTVFVLGLGISAFFWLPALTESKYTQVSSLQTGTNDYHQHFVYIDQLWNWPWGYGGSASERADGMSFKIGKLSLILGLVVFIGFFAKSLMRKKIISLRVILFLAAFLLTVFMMLPVSLVVWEIIPFAGYVQYPWRFLVFSLFFISCLCGGIFFIINQFIHIKYFRKGTILFLIIATVFLNVKYFQPQNFNFKNDKDYTDDKKIKWDISKISDEYLPRYFPKPQTIEDIALKNYSLTDDIIVKQSEFKSNFAKIDVSSVNQGQVVFNRAYFPGWYVVLDQQQVKPEILNGIIKVSVPNGEHQITLYFDNTSVRFWGNVISIISMAVIFFFCMRINKEKFS